MGSRLHVDGSVQDCSISTANALEILQSCTKPSMLERCNSSVLAHRYIDMGSRMHVDGSVQDCSISTANAVEILQSCTKPSMWPTCDLMPALSPWFLLSISPARASTFLIPQDVVSTLSEHSEKGRKINWYFQKGILLDGHCWAYYSGNLWWREVWNSFGDRVPVDEIYMCLIFS